MSSLSSKQLDLTVIASIPLSVSLAQQIFICAKQKCLPRRKQEMPTPTICTLQSRAAH